MLCFLLTTLTPTATQWFVRVFLVLIVDTNIGYWNLFSVHQNCFHTHQTFRDIQFFLALNMPWIDQKVAPQTQKNFKVPSPRLRSNFHQFYLVCSSPKVHFFRMISTKITLSQSRWEADLFCAPPRPRCVFYFFTQFWRKKNSQGKNIRKKSEKNREKFQSMREKR